MLSTKIPSDPSCSSKLPSLRSGESASEKPALQEGDSILEGAPSQNFSIRDYVFSSRSEGIEKSWPFTQHTLQLFLKHGVKDLLPPFEPPGLVRDQCCRKGVEPVQLVVCSEVEQILEPVNPQGEAASIRQDPCSLLDKQTLDGKRITYQRIREDELGHCDPGIGLTRTNDQVGRNSSEIGGLSCSVAINKGVSEALTEIDIAEPTKNLERPHEALGRNCRLIVKLGITSESGRAEDIISNSSTVSDPMASKVCPVCKTFSSTSNTTLNAHIDQCLSMESNTKLASSKFLKPKVKPGKKRLMVDIYATAPRCTLEDLDKRNGTNWAVELAFAAAPIISVDIEAKKPKLSPTDSRGHVNVGAVYVDSNGIKLRILSKFNDTLEPKEGLKLQKHEKVTESKSFLISKNKNKNFTEKYSKKLKLKAQRKKLRSFMPLRAQTQTAPEGDCNAEHHYENGESILEISALGDVAEGSRPTSLRQWMCSRRSEVSKKLVRKNFHSTSDNIVPVTRSKLAEGSQLDPGNASAAISHHSKFSGLSEDLTSSQKTNRNELLSKMVHSTDYGMRKFEKLPISTSRWSPKTIVNNGHMFRTSNSSGNIMASSRRKTNEIGLGIQHRSDNSSERTNITSEVCCPSTKGQIISTLKENDSVIRTSFNLEARKSNLNEKLPTCKNFRKHRSIFRSGKSRAEFQSATNGVHGLGVDILRTSKAQKSCELEHSKSVTITGAGKMMNHTSPIRKEVSGSEEGYARSIVEELKHGTLKKSCLGTDSFDLDVENLDMQEEIPDIENNVSKSSMEMNAENPCSNDAENQQAAIGARLVPSPLLEHAQSTSGDEVHVKQLLQRYDKKEECCGDAFRKEINGLNIQIADEMEDTGNKRSYVVHPTECAVDTISIQESSGCLTSHGGDVEPEITQKSTSITSVRTIIDNAMNLASDGEPCGSPISTASTVSLPSPKHSNYTDPDAELLGRATDKSGLMAPINDNAIADEERNVEGKSEDLKVNLSAKQPDQSIDDKPFCCSCGESFSRESQLLKQNTTHRTAKGKQVSNLFGRPRASSSFSSYQNRGTNTKVNSSLQPAVQSTYAKGLSDSAMPSYRSQNQSISNPILRLMGKNLMVGNNEGFVRPQTTVLDYTSQVNLLSPLGFASTNNNLLKQENFPYCHQIYGGSPGVESAVSIHERQFPMHMPNTLMPGFPVTPLHTTFVPRYDQKILQKNAYNRPNSSLAHCMMNEVIVIDDSPKTCLSSPTSTLPFAASGLNHLSQRPFSSFSSENRIRHLPTGPRPLLPNPYSVVNSSLMKRSSTSEGHGPLISTPFVFQSPTSAHMAPSMCYSQNLH